MIMLLEEIKNKTVLKNSQSNNFFQLIPTLTQFMITIEEKKEYRRDAIPNQIHPKKELLMMGYIELFFTFEKT
ncbi:MAG: hypothetical protein JEY97_10265 [Bacteroidales bacterium]|nr:hypothetical protein [Bacteroidales bacterium]